MMDISPDIYIIVKCRHLLFKLSSLFSFPISSPTVVTFFSSADHFFDKNGTRLRSALPISLYQPKFAEKCPKIPETKAHFRTLISPDLCR
ncbi:hypothetical protein V6Z11_A10G101600 [Gossypium hirsutum]